MLCDFDRERLICDQEADSKGSLSRSHSLEDMILGGQNILAGSKLRKVFDAIVGSDLIHVPGGKAAGLVLSIADKHLSASNAVLNSLP